MPDVRSDSMVEATPVGGRKTGAAGGLTLTLRPRLVFRLIGPALIVAGLVGFAMAAMPAIALTIIGFVALLAWVPTVSVDEHEVRVRSLLKTEMVPLASVDEVRLRRVPFGPKRPGGRNHRIGRFCTIPMRLRIMEKDITLSQVTVVFWEGWPKLVRYLLCIPAITAEGRTLGRLDRYG